MRQTALSVLSLTLIWSAVGGAGLCGAMPQENKMQRQEARTPVASAPAPSPQIPQTRERQTQERRPMVPDVTGRPVGREAAGRPMGRAEGRLPERLSERRPLSPLSPGGRVSPGSERVQRYQGSQIIIPPPCVRLTSMPDMVYWRHRDLMAEIQWLSRWGFIPVSPVGDQVEALSDYSQQPAGWRAYGISVPAGGTIQVEVQHPKQGWFRLMLVDKWGNPGPGMLQAAIAHQPVMVTYKNPGKEATAVYILVDDPAWWSSEADPYTLQVRRDWDPVKSDLSQVKMVVGIWGASRSVSARFRGPSLTGPAVNPR